MPVVDVGLSVDDDGVGEEEGAVDDDGVEEEEGAVGIGAGGGFGGGIIELLLTAMVVGVYAGVIIANGIVNGGCRIGSDNPGTVPPPARFAVSSRISRCCCSSICCCRLCSCWRCCCCAAKLKVFAVRGAVSGGKTNGECTTCCCGAASGVCGSGSANGKPWTIPHPFGMS